MQLAYQEFVFKQPLAPFETGRLRSAVLQLTQNDDVLYHNHLKDGFLNKYPLIQYKSLQGQAAILYLGQAVNSINRLFKQIQTGKSGNKYDMSFEIDRISAKLYTLQMQTNPLTYDLINWLPLHNDDYKSFQQTSDPNIRKKLLIKILTGNILSFAKSVGWQVPEQIEITDFKIYKQKWISFKSEKFIGFNIRFSVNVFLPPHIGLGKGAAHNYGVVFPVRINNNEQLSVIKQNSNLS